MAAAHLSGMDTNETSDGAASLTQVGFLRRLTVTFEVSDADPMREDFGTRVFQPEHLVVDDSGGLVTVTVSGRQIRKDTSLGLATLRATYSRRRLDDHAPAWVRGAVAAHRAEYGSPEAGPDGATADARDRVIAALDDVWTSHDLGSADIPSSAENADAVLAALAVEGTAR